MTESARVPRRASRWPLRRIHKWMSVSIGVILLAWVVSGIIMMTPAKPLPSGRAATVDYGTMQVSLAQAVQTATAGADGAAIEWITTRRLTNRFFYVIGLAGNRRALVDAASGALTTITPELAGAIARDGLPESVTVTSVQRFETEQSGYDGPLPVYRVDLSEGITAWVGALAGEVTRRNASGRWHEFWGSIHTFRPVRRMAGRNTQFLSLVITGAISIAVALTGYWMALPKRARRAAA